MAKNNPNIRALILVNVPNQGSGMLQKLLMPADSNVQITEIQQLVSRTKSVLEQNNCSDSECGVIEGLESMVNNLVIVKSYYESAFPDHPFITYNTPLDIPVLTISGSAPNYSLAELLTAQSFNTSTNAYERCQEVQSDTDQQRLRDEQAKAILKPNTGFLASITDVLIGYLRSKQNATWNGFNVFDNLFRPKGSFNWVTSLAPSIPNLLSEQEVKIQQSARTNRRLAQQLKCRMAKDLLAAEWDYAMGSGGSNANLQSVFINPPFDENEFQACILHCSLEEALGVGTTISTPCRNFCDGVTDQIALGSFGTLEVWVPKNNNGILTEDEMRYNGAVAHIELPDVNHIAATKAFPNPQVSKVFEEIFAGAYGEAFCVPKQ